MQNKPNLIVPGFQKCGTATLHHLLQQHPAIFVPESKPHYFSGWQDTANRPDLYLDLFRQAKNGQTWISDTSDSYLLSYEALQGMRKLLGDKLVFVIIMRNPIKRIYSAYAHMRRPRLIGETREFSSVIDHDAQCLDDLISFEREQLVKSVQAGTVVVKRQRKLWGDNCLWNFRYIFNSTYSIHIENILKIFPESRFYFVALEEFVSDVRHNLAKIYDFLAIDSSVASNQFIGHRNKNFYITLNMDNPFVRNYWQASTVIRDRFPVRTVNYLFDKIEKVFLGKNFPSFMSPADATFLERLFRPEFEKVERLTGIDTAAWTRGS